MNNTLRTSDFFLLPVLICVWILFYPALNSGFFLDDYPNLVHLAEVRQEGFFYYIFSGVSSYLGRPLTLLSFALQYESWPANPYAFKAVNLFIHLVNGVLIFFITRNLAGFLKFSGNETAIISYGVVILWLVHPIQLSTTLYVVQRMTQLSTLFTLGGVLFYLNFRPLGRAGIPIHNAVIAGLVIWIFMLLGVLSKENGILLPLYMLVIEATILRRESYSRTDKLWIGIFLLLPLLLLVFYLLGNLDFLLKGYAFKPYTVRDRLLTESIVVCDYLFKILVPHPSAFSIYFDDYPAATGIFQPPATLVSLGFIGLLLTCGAVFNRRWPVLGFGIFWFLGGHLLESTFINLDFYFEHRNYLPAFGVFFVLGWALIMGLRRAHAKLLIGLMLIYLLLVISVTVMEIRLWAHPLEQATAWARTHPGSPRALENLGTQYIKTNNIPQAIAVYSRIAQQFPDQVYPELKVIALRACANDEAVHDDTWNALLDRAAHANHDRFNTVGEIHIIISSLTAGDCPDLDAEKIHKLINALTANPAFRVIKPYLYEEASLLSLYSGDIYNALNNVQQALNVSVNMSRLLFKAEVLMAIGDVQQAKNTLILIDKKMDTYRDRLAYGKSVERLREKLGALDQTLNNKGLIDFATGGTPRHET